MRGKFIVSAKSNRTEALQYILQSGCLSLFVLFIHAL